MNTWPSALHKMWYILFVDQEAAQRPPPLPRRPAEHDHRRYRRNSFIQSMENGPASGDDLPSPGSSDDYIPPLSAAAEQRLQASGGARSDQASGRQRSGNDSQRPGDISLNNSTQSSNRRHVSGENNVINNTHEVQQNQQNAQRLRKTENGGPPPPHRPGVFNPHVLPQDRPDVERWLASQPPDAARRRLRSDESDHIPDSPSPPGSYYSDEAFPPNAYVYISMIVLQFNSNLST